MEGGTGLTTTTAHTGTERYMAPELVNGDEPSLPTRESDVYAMGCVGLRVGYWVVCIKGRSYSSLIYFSFFS
jgi:serine/threonine protein kinase